MPGKFNVSLRSPADIAKRALELCAGQATPPAGPPPTALVAPAMSHGDVNALQDINAHAFLGDFAYESVQAPSVVEVRRGLLRREPTLRVTVAVPLENLKAVVGPRMREAIEGGQLAKSNEFGELHKEVKAALEEDGYRKPPLRRFLSVKDDAIEVTFDVAKADVPGIDTFDV